MPIPVQDAATSTALAERFGLKGKVSLSVDEIIVPVAVVRDFTQAGDVGGSPSVIHITTDGAFVVNGTVIAADYTVPLQRRAVIDYVQCSISLDDEVATASRIDLRLNVVPFGLAVLVGVFATLGPGYGFGTYPFPKVASGQMGPGDRWTLAMFTAGTTPAGRYTSVLHGIEFDE